MVNVVMPDMLCLRGFGRAWVGVFPFNRLKHGPTRTLMNRSVLASRLGVRCRYRVATLLPELATMLNGVQHSSASST